MLKTVSIRELDGLRTFRSGQHKGEDSVATVDSAELGKQNADLKIQIEPEPLLTCRVVGYYAISRFWSTACRRH